MEEYISLHTPKIGTRRFAIIQTTELSVMSAGVKEREMAFAGLFNRWKHWGRGSDPTVETHAGVMDMQVIRSYEKVAHEGRIAFLLRPLSNDAVATEVASLDLWCGGSYLHEEWFLTKHSFRKSDSPHHKARDAPSGSTASLPLKDVNFEIRLQQHHEEWRRLFLCWHNVEGFLCSRPIAVIYSYRFQDGGLVITPPSCFMF